MNCSICGREIEFREKKEGGFRGWVHRETGCPYIMKCKDCGYEGEQVNDLTCPKCGKGNYVDDHCVQPDWSVEPTGSITPLENYFRPLDKL